MRCIWCVMPHMIESTISLALTKPIKHLKTKFVFLFPDSWGTCFILICPSSSLWLLLFDHKIQNPLYCVRESHRHTLHSPYFSHFAGNCELSWVEYTCRLHSRRVWLSVVGTNTGFGGRIAFGGKVKAPGPPLRSTHRNLRNVLGLFSRSQTCTAPCHAMTCIHTEHWFIAVDVGYLTDTFHSLSKQCLIGILWSRPPSKP